MGAPTVIKGRYELREILGRGGMGIVYKGFDQVLTREVAIKTLLDISDPAFLELFNREYEILAHMNHPNIVKILDIGEFAFEGSPRPFFIMPLLTGTSLDKLIKTASQRLTVERVVDIISQTCRGLHAAHEKGLVHRDVKPNNIMVSDDDSVEIIDFGVAHVADAHSRTGLKGTLFYMAPEQLELKPPSALSDIFSLGVVAYETFTRRRPFEGATEREVMESILHNIPPPASDLNPMVNPTLARVIHKAMAKQPYHRFANARDLADALQKALHNQPIEIFDPARIRPRVQRAMKAFEQADYQFAAEILGELEAEGHIDSDLSLLRMKVNQAVRSKRLQQLLESARTRLEEQEFPLALQKVQEALELDPTNGTALGLKAEIEARRSESKIEDWLRLAGQHMENRAYGHAREALKNVLELKPKEARALQFLAEINKWEEEFRRAHAEKQQFYQSAMEAWSRGDVSSALSKIQRVLELEQKAPNTAAPERAATYQSFYNQVRSEHDAMNSAYAEAKALLSAANFIQASGMCDQYLAKYPGNALFQALKFDIGEKQRQQLSSQIAEVDRRVEAEPNLDKKVDILAEAWKRFPGERHFEQAMRSNREQRDLVNSIVAKARMLEEHGQFSDALSQWEILRNIYSLYPGLSHEIERIANRRDQQASQESKNRWVKQVDEQVSLGDYTRALGLLNEAKEEFPDDAELMEMEKLVTQGIERVGEALRLLGEGQGLLTSGKTEEGLATLREARRRDENNAEINRILTASLAEQAKSILDKDWRKADALIEEALDIDPGHSLAKSLRTLAQDRKRQESIEQVITEARRTQAQGDTAKALQLALQAIKQHGDDLRLSQLYFTLSREAEEADERRKRHQALEEVQRLEREAGSISDPDTLRSTVERMRLLYDQYEGDSEYQSAVEDAARRVVARLEALQQKKPPSPPMAPSQPKAVPAERAGASIPSPAPVPAPPKAVAPARRGKAIPPPAPVPSQPKAVPHEPPGKAIPSPALTDAPTAPLGPGSGLPSFTSVAQPPAAQAPPSTAPESATMLMRGDLIGPAGIGTPPPKAPGAGGFPGAAVGVAVPPPLKAPVTAEQPPKPPITAPQIHKAPAIAAPTPAESKRTVWVIGGIVAVLVLAVFGVAGYLLLHKTVSPPPTAETTPQPESPQPPPTTPPTPAATTLRILTDLESGSVSLDGNELGQLKEGQLSLDGIAAGNHTLAIAARGGRTEIAFETAPGALARLSKVKATGDLKVVAVTSLEPEAQVLSSFGPLKAVLDGKDAGEVGPTPLEVKELSAGTHALALGSGSDRKTISFETSLVPGLMTFISTDRNIGSLLVRTGEDGVTVTINGKPLRQLTSRGQLIVTNLVPRQYQIAVAKAGFQPDPSKTVSVAKGEEATVAFTLRPITSASLAIAGGPPSAKVFVDGTAQGTVRPDGTLTIANLPAGQHTIELRRDGFEPKQLTRDFASGQAVSLGGADVALAKVAAPRPAAAPPKLVVLTVPGAQVAIDQQALGSTDPSGKLETDKVPAGDHTLQVTASGFQSYQEKVSLSPNHVVTVKARMMAEFSVQHKHTIGGCRGIITVGNGRISYKPQSGDDGFDYPLTSVKTVGPADFGKGFYLDVAGGKRIFFHTEGARQDIDIILGAMKNN